MDGKRRRRRLGSVVVAIISAVAISTLALGWASASPANGVHQRIRLTEPYDQQSAVELDLGDPGFSTGDYGMYAGELYSADGSVHLGHENSHCTVGAIGDQTWQFVCSGYFVLRGAQITLQGTMELPLTVSPGQMRSPGASDSLEFHWAVTGGTDRYESVGGQLNWGGSDPNATILVFDLTR